MAVTKEIALAGAGTDRGTAAAQLSRATSGIETGRAGARQPMSAMASAMVCMATMKATQAGHLPRFQKMPGTTPAAVPPR